MTPLIEAAGLTKRFGKVEALAGLDIAVPPGQVVGLLGPNGAGKTTFVHMLATLLRPDAGTLRVAGYDVTRHGHEVRTMISLAGQFAAVEGAMTGRENLEMIARLYGATGADARASSAAVLEQLHLTEAADRLVRTYSGGMRRRLDLGASLVGAPRLLLLDEPTTGLDPASRLQLWDAIRGLASQGTDVLLTTQYLDEADNLAGRIVIIDHGRVIADGSSDELKASGGQAVIEVHARDDRVLAAAGAALGALGLGEPSVDITTRRVSLAVDTGPHRLTQTVRLLDDRGVEVDDIALRRPTLDEVFLALTGSAIEGTDPGPDRRGRTKAA